MSNLESIVEDDADDTAIDANTNDANGNMATGANNDAKKLPDDYLTKNELLNVSNDFC